MFAEEGTSEVLKEAPAQDRQAVLRAAVQRHVKDIDDQFLAVLNQYIASAVKREEAETVRILMGVREEVLNSVGTLLPPEVQVVDMLTVVGSVEGMDRILAAANAGGGALDGWAAVPACTMEKARAGPGSGWG